MVYRLSEVVRDVRVAMDRNMTSEQLFASADIETLALDDIIRSKVVEAVRRVEVAAPVHLLEEGHDFSDAGVYWGSLESGHVLLPGDFMRLIAFRMSDWERTVYGAISADDPEYARQSSRFKGVRGTPQKPVCAIVNRAEGKALEFYSCRSEDAYVERASYLPWPSIDEAGGIDISERCYQAVVYMAAALVFATYGANEQAAAMTELSSGVLV